MDIKKLTEDFLFKVQSKYKDVVLMSCYKDMKTPIYVVNKYGLCKLLPSTLLQNNLSIQSAICKNTYFLNTLRLTQLSIFNKYDFSEINYQKAISKLKVICEKHGEFFITPSSLLQGCGCNKCGVDSMVEKRKRSYKEIITLANSVHSNKYKYIKEKDLLIAKKDILTCICPNHGKFKQKISYHLSGKGCSECAKENRSNNYGYTKWENNGLKSKNFNSFKLYIIKCWNEDEHFFKIGKTYTKLKKRFKKSKFNYNYNIVFEVTDTATNISILEKELQKFHKNYKYIPITRFSGFNECFSNINFDYLNKTLNT